MTKDIKKENREEFLRQSQVRGWVTPDLEYVVDASFDNTIDACIEVVEIYKKTMKIPYQALRLSGCCPGCGAEVNQKFVDNEFKEAVAQACDDIIKDFKALK